MQTSLTKSATTPLFSYPRSLNRKSLRIQYDFDTSAAHSTWLQLNICCVQQMCVHVPGYGVLDTKNHLVGLCLPDEGVTRGEGDRATLPPLIARERCFARKLGNGIIEAGRDKNVSQWSVHLLFFWKGRGSGENHKCYIEYAKYSTEV